MNFDEYLNLKVNFSYKKNIPIITNGEKPKFRASKMQVYVNLDPIFV